MTERSTATTGAWPSLSVELGGDRRSPLSPPSACPSLKRRSAALAAAARSTCHNGAWPSPNTTTAAVCLGTTTAIMAPFMDPRKRLVCRRKAAGSGGLCPLGAAMDSSAWSRRLPTPPLRAGPAIVRSLRRSRRTPFPRATLPRTGGSSRRCARSDRPRRPTCTTRSRSPGYRSHRRPPASQQGRSR
jgi:hypothetical protein